MLGVATSKPFMSRIKQSFSHLGQQMEQAVKRGLDRHVRLGVTGISGAGKTAFITSLVNQILNGESQFLPAWQVLEQGRFLGAKLAPQPDLTLQPFDYSGAVGKLKQGHWPPSTHSISEIRLLLRYQPSKGLAGQFGQPITLTLDIIDYPGEWLLDLPLLGQEYAQWCAEVWPELNRGAWQEHSRSWCQKVRALEGNEDNSVINELACEYAELLKTLKQQYGASLLQPGRALLPGELAGAPALAWFPLPPSLLERLSEESPLRQTLSQRFSAYCDEVVEPFFRHYFAKLDRQVVLVDCLSALNYGRDQTEQLALTLSRLSHSFHYGPGSMLTRLFRPRIDKVLFAASKADHITADQQPALLQLMHSLLKESRRQPKYFGTEIETLVLSAINATEQAKVSSAQNQSVIKGRDLDGQWRVRYPGEVPRRLPDADFWQQQGFDFSGFMPPLWQGDEPLPQMRMDYAMQFLLGDKMR